MTDDLHVQIGKLHAHIDHVSNQVRAVQDGQDLLHKEHTELRDRVEHLERTVSKDINDLASHEREANIYRSHLVESFGSLQKTVENLDTKFESHAAREDEDRKVVIRGQQTTIRSIILAAITFFTTGAVLLWQTGVLA